MFEVVRRFLIGRGFRVPHWFRPVHALLVLVAVVAIMIAIFVLTIQRDNRNPCNNTMDSTFKPDLTTSANDSIYCVNGEVILRFDENNKEIPV